MNRSSALVACLLAATALVPLAAAAQDMAKTAGKHVKVLLDNDKVRVLELQLPPGAKTGMHSHGDNVVYFVTAADTITTSGDGSKKTAHRSMGETLWSGPVTHDTQNAGKMSTRTVVIELKAPAKTP